MELFTKLLNENLNEITVAIVVATFYVLLGLDDDVMSKKYLKKFNVLLYLLLALILIIFNLPILIMILVFLFIFFISSFNMLEYSSSIEKNLNHKDLIIFSFIKWFFHTKIFIFIIFAIGSSISFYKFENTILTVLILFIGTLVHQISFAKDTFSYRDFDYLYDKLTKNSGFTLAQEKEEHFVNLLGYILFVEDKDYFHRSGLRFEIKPVVKRNRNRYLDTIKNSNWSLLHPNNLKRLIKKYWRGYSSIEMQVVRRTILGPGSYQSLVRRKILIEHFYTEYFYRATIRLIRRYNKTAYDKNSKETDELIHSNLKTLFLLYYYNQIKGKPNNIEEFIKNNDSRLDKKVYDYFQKTYIKGEYDDYYKSVLRENWKKFNEIHYPGRVIMNFYQIMYGEDGSIYYEKSEGKNQFIEYNNATQPQVSPNNKKFIYISPYEWETKSSLYLYDLVDMKKQILIEPSDDDYIPKKAMWISDNLIAVIIGYAYGTIAVGGNVYLYDLAVESYSNLSYYGENIQITAMSLSTENNLSVEGIEYIDEQKLNSREFKDMINLPIGN